MLKWYIGNSSFSLPRRALDLSLYVIFIISARKTANVNFSAEEEKKFRTRYENGYDLPDERYSQWLQKHHPSSAKKLNGMEVVVVLYKKFYMITLKVVEVTARLLCQEVKIH